MRLTSLALVLPLMGVSSCAIAAEHMPHSCVSLKDFKARVGDAKVKEATPGQYHFLQGIYAMAPNTPPGLPPGKGALILTAKDINGSIVLFVDGAKVCDPLPFPAEGMKMLSAINTGALDGEGREI